MSAYLVSIVVSSADQETAHRIATAVADWAATVASESTDGDAETFVADPVEVVRT